MESVNHWAFYISLLTFLTVVFNKVWDEFIRRQQKKENEALKAKADKAVEVAQNTRQEIVSKVEENTELTRKAKDAAEEAVRVANNTHEKIVHIGEKRNEMFDALLYKVIGDVKEESGGRKPSDSGRSD